MRLLPTSMVMEITAKLFQNENQPTGRSDVILPSVPPQFPRHVSSENMSVCVCVFEQTKCRDPWIHFYALQVRCFVLVWPEKHSLTIFDVKTGLWSDCLMK